MQVRGEGVGRVYASGQQFPGLAVSRAFGDADGKKIGVTVDPQFIGWKIRPEVSAYTVPGSPHVCLFESSARDLISQLEVKARHRRSNLVFDDEVPLKSVLHGKKIGLHSRRVPQLLGYILGYIPSIVICSRQLHCRSSSLNF